MGFKRRGKDVYALLSTVHLHRIYYFARERRKNKNKNKKPKHYLLRSTHSVVLPTAASFSPCLQPPPRRRRRRSRRERTKESSAQRSVFNSMLDQWKCILNSHSVNSKTKSRLLTNKPLPKEQKQHCLDTFHTLQAKRVRAFQNRNNFLTI